MPAEDDDQLDDAVVPTEDAADEGLQQVQLRIRRRLPGRRLDKYLQSRFPHLSRAAVQRLIKQGAIRVNGQPTKSSYEMNGGDLIDLQIPAPAPLEIIPEDIPIQVLHEDEHLIAINKQAGIICHPARSDQTGTLVNALAFYSNSLSRNTDPFRPGIVHRLDKNTTGVMLVAKQDEAHWRLSLQFERRTVQKIYLAVVEGELALDSDVVDAPIGVHPVVREKFAVMIRENKINVAKEAITAYEVAERFRGYTLVRLFPKTGRTHQLRVHMSHIGHPIVGDNMYGARYPTERAITGAGDNSPFLRYQALHAWKIRFKHPILETPMEIEAPFHDELRRLVQMLRTHRGV